MIDRYGATKIGYCSVDSGQIMIVDPCYVVGRGADNSEEDYDRICEVTLDNQSEVKCAGPIFEGHAIASGTLYGDGRYPVWAEVDSNGRVRSLTIDFDPESYEDEEDDYDD